MLIGNYSVIAKSPARFRSGTSNCDRSAYGNSGPSRNIYSTFAKFNSVPSGGTAWIIAQVSGGLATFTILGTVSETSAVLAGGKAASASLSALISTTQAQLDQIANLAASIFGSLDVTQAQLAAVAAASASFSASIAITQCQLGAIVGLAAAMNGSISASANNFATADISASISSLTALSPDSLANSIWNSLAASFNAAGTMGEKLNGAGSAGNPWTEVIESGLTASDIMRILLSVAAGETTITPTGGDTATVKFKSQNAAVDRILASMVGSERISITVNGA